MSENRHSLMIHSVKDFEIQLNDQDYELLKRTILPELQEELELARSIQDEVIKQNETLTKQLVELQSDKVELIAQRDTWIGKANALCKQHIAEMAAKVEALEWRDKEICALRAELDEIQHGFESQRYATVVALKENDALRKQLDIAVKAIKEIRLNVNSGKSALFSMEVMYTRDAKFFFVRAIELADDVLAAIEKEGKPG